MGYSQLQGQKPTALEKQRQTTSKPALLHHLLAFTFKIISSVLHFMRKTGSVWHGTGTSCCVSVSPRGPPRLTEVTGPVAAMRLGRVSESTKVDVLHVPPLYYACSSSCAEGTGRGSFLYQYSSQQINPSPTNFSGPEVHTAQSSALPVKAARISYSSRTQQLSMLPPPTISDPSHSSGAQVPRDAVVTQLRKQRTCPSRLLPQNYCDTFYLPDDFPKHPPALRPGPHLLCQSRLEATSDFPFRRRRICIRHLLFMKVLGESSRLPLWPQASMQVQAQRAQIRLASFSQGLLAIFSPTVHRITAEPMVTENLPLQTCLISAPFFQEQYSKVTLLWLLETALVCFLLQARPSSSLLFAYRFVTFPF